MSLAQYVGYRFESSTVKTPEFAAFARTFRAHIKKHVIGYELMNMNVGHFYLSGFLRNAATGKMAYFLTSDVRFFPDEWNSNLLVRTAQHERDYTGGRNDFCRLSGLPALLDRLTA